MLDILEKHVSANSSRSPCGHAQGEVVGAGSNDFGGSLV